MTRLEFRARVTSPRPASAWLMALVASASLWITGQLEPWVILLQLVCFGFSFHTRDDPPAWRRSPIWLNVGMFGITGVTISQALHGSPATLSLAYFASLSLALQLIDARPRKSEFLLVALALFQVILAASLTDSVLYPPLVVIFLVAVTWTLMVHTLRTEAAEAGDANAAQRAITPGLRRNTLIASGLSIAIALVLFVLLPRMRSSVLSGGIGSSRAVAGFSDKVSLGSIGRIRRDAAVVLRIETLAGTPPARGDAYWRGLAFDRFDGRSWSISKRPGQGGRAWVSGSARFGVDLAGGPQPGALVQRIVREPVEAGVLFAAGAIRRIEGPLDQLELDANGGLYFPASPNERIRYTLWSSAGAPGDPELQRDRAAPPDEKGPLAVQRQARWLELPRLDPAIGVLARRITSGLASDAERARAIEQHLRRSGRYTDDPPDLGNAGLRSPVEDFLLGELSGHCEYFASAMVVLARSVELPARLVNGFAGGRDNDFGGFTEVTRSDAHAWVEVHYERAGWVRYDPTPPDLRLRGASGLTLLEQLGDLASVIELWWFQRVVDFDSSDQVLALRSVYLFAKQLFEDLLGASGPQAAADAAEGARAPERRWRPSGTALPRSLLAGAAVVAIGLVLLAGLRRTRGGSRMPAAYARALRLLARRDLQRSPTTSARGFLAEVRGRVPEPAAACFARITEAYLAERFGGVVGGAQLHALSHDLADLRRHLRRRGRSRGHTTASA